MLAAGEKLLGLSHTKCLRNDLIINIEISIRCLPMNSNLGFTDSIDSFNRAYANFVESK